MGDQALRDRSPRRQPIPETFQTLYTPLKLHMDAGISLLPTGSTITLRTASGDIIDERCGLPKEFTVSSKPINAKWLTSEWSERFSAFMRVPWHECISFTWSKDGHLHYNVLVVFIPLNYESAGYILSRSFWTRCRVCTMTMTFNSRNKRLSAYGVIVIALHAIEPIAAVDAR